MYQNFNDAELVVLLREGDRTAFTEIYNRYHWLLHIHSYKWMRNREEAKDIIHELFSNLWIKREELTFGVVLSTYLYAAVRNRIFNVLAHKKIESKYLSSLGDFLDTGECITDHLVRESQLAEVIERELANMPSKMRNVFELSRKQHLTHKKIAEELDISEQTVRKHIQNALRILRVKLGLLSIMIVILFS